MPLVDSFGRVHTYLRIAVTDRCNLRCSYCMPRGKVPWKPTREILTLEETSRIARMFIDSGIEKVRLTGGEPTLRAELEGLIREFAGLEHLKTIAMTTNGVMLAQKAMLYRRAGLDLVNISLDTLRAERFRAITLRDELPRVLEGIEAALVAGFAAVKLNVVVMGGVNDDECFDFVEFARTRALQVRFIEFMPFPGNPWLPHRYIPWRTLLSILQTRYELEPIAPDTIGRVREYRVAGHAGTVGFISPLSEEFCADCNRLRLTADGSLKSCLFYPAEVNLRDPLRSGATDAELHELVISALAQKCPTHPPVCVLGRMENRCMTQIGG